MCARARLCVCVRACAHALSHSVYMCPRARRTQHWLCISLCIYTTGWRCRVSRPRQVASELAPRLIPLAGSGQHAQVGGQRCCWCLLCVYIPLAGSGQHDQVGGQRCCWCLLCVYIHMSQCMHTQVYRYAYGQHDQVGGQRCRWCLLPLCSWWCVSADMCMHVWMYIYKRVTTWRGAGRDGAGWSSAKTTRSEASVARSCVCMCV